MRINAVGFDPLFGYDFQVLIKRAETDIEHVVEKAPHVIHLYNWDFYSILYSLKEFRTLTFRRFEKNNPIGILEKSLREGRVIRTPL